VTEESLIREAHERFRATLREQPTEPAITTRHRARCPRPGWQLVQCLRPSGVQLARCIDATCEAVELRTTDKETP
jgi:hypothetical protein